MDNLPKSKRSAFSAQGWPDDFFSGNWREDYQSWFLIFTPMSNPTTPLITPKNKKDVIYCIKNNTLR
jgi:hypothetical protein